MTRTIATVLILSLMACTGDTTDDTTTDETNPTDGTADTGTEPAPVDLTGVWEGDCSIMKGKKSVSLLFRMYLEQGTAGALDGFGTVGFSRTAGKKSKTSDDAFGISLLGMYDDETMDVSLDFSVEGTDVAFAGTLDDDMMEGPLSVSFYDKKKKTTKTKYPGYECLFARQ